MLSNLLRDWLRRPLQRRDAEMHYRTGLALRNHGKLEAAAESYQRALAIRPDYIEAHNNLGALQQLQGRSDEALTSYRRAVELAPQFSEPYLNLGRLSEARGDLVGAAHSYRRAIDNGIEPEAFGHLLNAVEGITTDRAPAHYLRLTFDEFSAHFDRQLVDHLGYRIPEILAARIAARFTGGDLRVLDLGCGTGLCGVHLKPLGGKITGIDLSPQMLAKAQERGIYDALLEQDILDYLQHPAGQFNVVVAADLLIYLGKLDALFDGVARALQPAGVFAFSIEVATDGRDFVLQQNGRYAQALHYIRRLATNAGLNEAEAFAQTIRGTANHAAPGYVFLLTRP